MSDPLGGFVREELPSDFSGHWETSVAEAKRAVSELSGFLAKGASFPLLTNFHLACSQGTSWLTASDGILTGRSPIEATHSLPIPVLLPGALFQQMVREAPGSKLRLEVVSKGKSQTCLIRSGSAKWGFPLHTGAHKFPKFQLDTLEFSQVDAEILHLALKSVRPAVSDGSFHPSLATVAVEKGTFRATDGARGHQYEGAFPLDTQLPKRLVEHLIPRIHKLKEAKVFFAQTDKTLVFWLGSTLLIGQKQATEFPPVAGTFLDPALCENGESFKVPRQGFLAALKRVRLASDEDTGAVLLSLNKGSLSIESKDRMGKFSVEEIPTDWNYPPRSVSLSHQHLSDLLAQVPDEEVSFLLSKELKTRPAVVSTRSGPFFAVLSQIRADWL